MQFKVNYKEEIEFQLGSVNIIETLGLENSWLEKLRFLWDRIGEERPIDEAPTYLE